MKIGTTYDIIFTTNRADTWALADADSTPVVRITENGSLMPYIPPVTNISTWKYIVTIDTLPDENGFSPFDRYTVYATATVNWVEWAIWLDHFVGEERWIDDVLPTDSYVPETVYTPEEIREELETSTILAKQASVIAIPTNPLLTTDTRLDNLGWISWDDLIEPNSNVPWSFGQKFAQYWGVSHVIREIEKWGKWFTEKEMNFLNEINERLKKIENKPIGDKIIEVTKIEKIPVASFDSKTVADIIVEWLKDVRWTVIDIMVNWMTELKNKK